MVPRRATDALAGLVLLALASSIWLLNARFAIGTLRAMGPGYMPRALAGLLALIGVGLVVFAWAGPRAAAATWRPRAVVMLAAAMLAFALLIERAGLIAASIAAIILAAAAGRDSRMIETIAFAIAAALFASIVFVWGLGQVMPLLPPAWTS